MAPVDTAPEARPINYRVLLPGSWNRRAVHLGGGIIALLWAGSASLLKKPLESRRIVVDISAWYWHFMAVLWVYIFALLGFAK